ncbi:MAG TPA: MgtC/SapB family protein [Planctomycetota bacterium]|nr:MgtC/SapB family protein [Planctomycetota bacterium]
MLDTFQRLGLAAALGLLVGLQREHAGTNLAGIRTFPLFTIFGTLCALLTGTSGPWLVTAGLLAVCALLVIGNIVQRGNGRDGGGITTEIAALVMYALGAYLVQGEAVVAVVVAGALAVLLHLKPQMHALVHRIEAKDFKAVMQFVLISLVILPLLPDRTYGPYDVLNPRNMW